MTSDKKRFNFSECSPLHITHLSAREGSQGGEFGGFIWKGLIDRCFLYTSDVTELKTT